MADLGEAVGLGRGGLYHHIGSKEDLLYEIIESFSKDMTDRAEALLDEDLASDVKVRRMTHYLMALVAENLPELTVFFSDFRALGGERRKAVLRERERFERIYRDLMEEGVRQGAFRPVDPLVVKGILGIFNHSHLWLRPDGKLSPADVADLIADFILAGLRR
jgi:AcrR family transcriptional regulator